MFVFNGENHDIRWALEQLVYHDCMVRRKAWDSPVHLSKWIGICSDGPHVHIVKGGPKFKAGDDSYQPTIKDCITSDWEIYDPDANKWHDAIVDE